MAKLMLGLVIGAAMASSVGSVMRSMDTSLGRLQSRSSNIKLGLELGSGYQSISKEFNKVSAEMAKTAAPSDRLKQKFNDLKGATAAAARKAQEYGLNLVTLSKDMGALERASKQSEASIARVNARMARKELRSELRGSMMGMVGSALAVAAPIKTAMNFEQSMAKVGAITRTTTDKGRMEEFKRLEEEAKRLGLKTQYSASEAADGMSYLAMAGFNTEQILNSMPGMLDLAASGAMDLASSADIASNILSGFSLDAKEMNRVSDVLVRGFTTSNTNLMQLGDAMKYVAPVASKASTSLEDTAAMVGLLGNVGIQGSMAGTTLRAALVRLIQPPKKAADALKVLGREVSEEELAQLNSDFYSASMAAEELGLSLTDSEGNMRSLPNILEQIAAATKGMGSAQKQAALAMIFGQDAVAGMTELVDQAGSGKLKEYIALLKQSGDAAATTAQAMNNTLKGAFIELGSALEGLAINSATPLLEPLKLGVKCLAALVSQAGILAQEFPNVSLAIGGVGAALVGLKLASLAGRYGFTFVQDGASMLWGGLQHLRPSVIQTSLDLLRMKGSGSALGGVLASVRGKVFSLREGLSADWGALKSGLSWVGSGMKSAALATWSFSKGALLSLGASLKSAGLDLVSFAKTAIPSAIAGIKAMGAAMLANPIGLAVAGIALAAGALIYYWDDVKQFFLKIWDPVKPYWESFTGWLGSLWDSVMAAWNSIKEFFSPFFNALEQPVHIFSSVVGGCIGGLGSIWQSVIDAWGNVSGLFTGVFESIKAPFAEFGKWVDEQIAKIGQAWKNFKESIFGNDKERAALKEQNTHAIFDPSVWGMPGHATGGIFNRPHVALFAEEGEEAAIPLSSKHRGRGRSIWASAGIKLGMLPESMAVGDVVKMPFFSQYASSGSDDAVPAASLTAGGGGGRSMVQQNTFKIEIHTSGGVDNEAIQRIISAIEDKMAQRDRGAFEDAPCFG